MPANDCTSWCCAARARRLAIPIRGTRESMLCARAARNRSQPRRWSAGSPRVSGNASRKQWSASSIWWKAPAPKASSLVAKLCAKQTSAKALAQSARRLWLSPALTIRAQRLLTANSWPSKLPAPVMGNSTPRTYPTSSSTTVSPRRCLTFCGIHQSPQRRDRRPVAQVGLLDLRILRFQSDSEELFASRSPRRTELRRLFDQNRRARKSEVSRNIVDHVYLAHVEAGLQRQQRQIDMKNHRFAVRGSNLIRHNGLGFVNFRATLQKLNAGEDTHAVPWSFRRRRLRRFARRRVRAAIRLGTRHRIFPARCVVHFILQIEVLVLRENVGDVGHQLCLVLYQRVRAAGLLRAGRNALAAVQHGTYAQRRLAQIGNLHVGF